MNNSRSLVVLCAACVMLISTSINASLIDRGGGLIYDDDLDITWMENPSYGAHTSQTNAIAWADSLVFGGLDDWRLPTTFNVDPSCGTDATDKRYLTLTPCSGGELGHLFYGEGLTYAGIPGAGQFGTLSLLDEVIFNNVFGGGYWTDAGYLWTEQPYEDTAGTVPTAEKPYPRVPLDGFGWLFYFGGDPGAHKTLLATTATRGVWAVRDGDVLAAVPLPGAVWLFSSGLLGLAGLARRKAKRG